MQRRFKQTKGKVQCTFFYCLKRNDSQIFKSSMLQNIFACCIAYDAIETCVITGRVDIIFVKVYRYSEGFLAKI